MPYLRPVVALLTVGVLLVGAQSPTASQANDGELKKATFAGGCFWCMEPPFDELDGVVSTTSGYTGGNEWRPTYEEVSAGVTGHAEAVEILYDPSKISYAQLLEVFWRNVDPLTPNRQFCDSGSQYRTAIFYHDEEQKRLARESKERLEQSGRFDDPIRDGRSTGHASSTPPRNITRTTTRKTRSATRPTGGAVAATSDWSKSGARSTDAKRASDDSGQFFTPRRISHHYCSGRCRAAASRQRNAARLTEPLDRLWPDDPGRPE